MKYKNEYPIEIKKIAHEIVDCFPNMMKILLLANKNIRPEKVKLSMHHFQILNILNDEGNLTVNELKSILKLAQSTVSQHLSKLLKDGYVNLKIDPYDRRKTIVEITAKVKEVIKIKREEFVEKHCYYLNMLEKDDRERIVEAYKTISEITSKILKKVKF
ncbi:MAG TPA: MarR family winged helix-turn-helix transcriptional regulator [Ignavibacteriales bacterium]|nr:MarR family winged helix-turn-helix transcriptional regulator [Ignavibacteriales bacterium]